MGKSEEDSEEDGEEKEVDEGSTDEKPKDGKNQGDDSGEKPIVTKVKTATLKVARVEKSEWLEEKLAAMDGQIAELSQQLTSLQKEKLKSKARKRMFSKHKR